MNIGNHSPSSGSVVGLVPAAGRASRLGRLPCSKEVYPVGWTDSRPKVVSHYLFDQLRMAGVDTTYVVLRKGKWDIPEYWGDGQDVGLHIAYVIMRTPYGTPFTLDQAFPFVRTSRVALGFPDILIAEPNLYPRLLAHQEETESDVVLGLFTAERPEKVDMVRLDDRGRPTEFVIKPKATTLTDTWLCAVWTPTFTLYLHDLVAELAPGWDRDEELFLGDVFQRALRDGLSFASVRFPDARYVDIGTPDALWSVRQRPDAFVEPD